MKTMIQKEDRAMITKSTRYYQCMRYLSDGSYYPETRTHPTQGGAQAAARLALRRFPDITRVEILLVNSSPVEEVAR